MEHTMSDQPQTFAVDGDKIGAGQIDVTPPEAIPTAKQLQADAEKRVTHLKDRVRMHTTARDTAVRQLKIAKEELEQAERVLRSFEPHHRGPRKPAASKKSTASNDD
jgi:hypothetical protein